MRRLFLMVIFQAIVFPTCPGQADVSRGLGSARSDSASKESRASFVLSRIDDRVVGEFEVAWKQSSAGTGMTEAVVLIFRMADGSIKAIREGHTNQAYKFTFRWNSSIIAIVHTHANKHLPQPSEHDIMMADRFDRPIFTITVNGMYLYDPAARKTSKLLDGLDWLKLSSWTRYSQLAAGNKLAKGGH